jgi:malonyl-CoA decarboxylase
VTLSPVPGFARWLNKGLAEADARVVTAQERGALAGLQSDGWLASPDVEARLKAPMMNLAARYLLAAKAPDGRPLDPVARFHLGNGARLQRINWPADRSARALREAHGLMVNYRYDIKEIEANHEAYANEARVVASRSVRALLTTHERMPVTQRLLGAAAKPAVTQPAALPAPAKSEAAPS